MKYKFRIRESESLSMFYAEYKKGWIGGWQSCETILGNYGLSWYPITYPDYDSALEALKQFKEKLETKVQKETIKPKYVEIDYEDL